MMQAFTHTTKQHGPDFWPLTVYEYGEGRVNDRRPWRFSRSPARSAEIKKGEVEILWERDKDGDAGTLVEIEWWKGRNPIYTRRGYWELVEIRRVNIDRPQLVAVARCTGPGCEPKTVRSFDVSDWANRDPQHCQLCRGHV